MVVIMDWFAIPVRLIRVAKNAVGISLETRLIPHYLLEYRYFVAWVDVNGATWRQEFTLLKRIGKRHIYLLATGDGGRTLKELYKQGIRLIFIRGLVPAEEV